MENERTVLSRTLTSLLLILPPPMVLRGDDTAVRFVPWEDGDGVVDNGGACDDDDDDDDEEAEEDDTLSFLFRVEVAT